MKTAIRRFALAPLLALSLAAAPSARAGENAGAVLFGTALLAVIAGAIAAEENRQNAGRAEPRREQYRKPHHERRDMGRFPMRQGREYAGGRGSEACTSYVTRNGRNLTVIDRDCQRARHGYRR